MFNSKRIEQLIGETVREVGTLVIVFAPLDAAFTGRSASGDGLSLIMTMILAFMLIVSGILLEAED